MLPGWLRPIVHATHSPEPIYIMHTFGFNNKIPQDYDKNANGELDFPEFVEMMAKNNITLSNIGEENIRDAFRAFDR